MSEEPEATNEVSEAQPAAAERPVEEAPASRAASGRPARQEKPGRRRDRPRPEGITWPVLLIFAGVMLLLYTTGWHGVAWWRIWVLWPALLILLGLDIWLRRAAPWVRLLVAMAVLVVLVWAAMYALTMPGGEGRAISCGAGEAKQGRVVLDMGVGRLEVGAVDRDAGFASGLCQGQRVTDSCTYDGDLVSLKIGQWGEGVSWWPVGQNADWMLDLDRAVPLQSLDVKVGAGDSTLRLESMHLQSLQVQTGVGRTWVTLPGPEGAATTTVSIGVGVGAIEVTIPQGVAAEIRVDAGVGNVSVDQGRFPWRDGAYRSEGYDTAAYRLQIDLHSGVGTITVK